MDIGVENLNLNLLKYKLFLILVASVEKEIVLNIHIYSCIT